MARITPGAVAELAEYHDPHGAIITPDVDDAFTVRVVFRAPSGTQSVRIRYTHLTTTIWPVVDEHAPMSPVDRITLGRNVEYDVLSAIVRAL